MLPNVPHYVIAYLAIFRSGATVVPVSYGLSEYELTPLLEEVEVDTIIYWSGDTNQVDKAVAKLPLVKRLIVLGEKQTADSISFTKLMSQSHPDMEPVDLDDDDIAIIKLGSGVSGRPVGAEFTHSAIAANAIATRDTLEITPQDRIVAVLPLTHSAGEGLVLNLFIASGCTLVMSPRFDPQALSRELRSGSATILAAYPSMLQALVESAVEESISPTLRLTLCTGGVLEEDLLKDFEQRFGGYTLECYTMRDAGPVVAINKWRTGRRVGSLGHPLAGVEMRIIGKSGKECSIGEVGEIVVRGSAVMRSYSGRPRLSRHKMPDKWIRTEDYGRMDINGFFYYSGSDLDRVMVEGKSFYIQEIERLLSIHPDISDSVVVITYDEDNTPILKACVVPANESHVTTESLAQLFRQNLSPHKCPEMIRFYKDLPRNEAGDINRDELAGFVKTDAT